MNTEMLDNLMFLCLHAPKDVKQLKACMPAIIQIWKDDCKRGRYSACWKHWAATVDEMNHQEEILNELRSRTSYDEKTNKLGVAEVSDLIQME
jgi:hypothetical protein